MMWCATAQNMSLTVSDYDATHAVLENVPENVRVRPGCRVGSVVFIEKRRTCEVIGSEGRVVARVRWPVVIRVPPDDDPPSVIAVEFSDGTEVRMHENPNLPDALVVEIPTGASVGDSPLVQGRFALLSRWNAYVISKPGCESIRVELGSRGVSIH